MKPNKVSIVEESEITNHTSQIKNEPVPARRAEMVTVDALAIEMWAVEDLSPHPDNPRTVNLASAKFLDLVESIKRNGVLEPLTVRVTDDPGFQVLSGHRRLAAAKEAGLDQVPIRNLGAIPDDLAYDIVAMANLHEDLTPLEEGKRAAVWLDKYGQDAKAVAAKLGKTERWVRLHAQIDRGLIPAWKEAAVAVPEQKVNRYGYADHSAERNDFTKWTAGHWVLIARLPADQQEYWLGKILKDYRFDPHDATVEQVEGWLKCEQRLLAKAPFDREGCAGCPKRTDSICQLLWDEAEAAESEAGKGVRCLDVRCWDRKCARAERDKFRELSASLIEKSNIKHQTSNLPAPVPISLVEEPDWSRRDRYRKQISALKKVHGKALVESDRVTLAKEGDKGAVPAIVVAGKGKGSIKWVKIAAPKKGAGERYHEPTPEERAADERRRKEAEAERQRRARATMSACKEIAAKPQPEEREVILSCLLLGCWPVVTEWTNGKHRPTAAYKTLSEAWAPGRFLELAWENFVARVKRMSRDGWDAGREYDAMRVVAPLFGIDLDAKLQAQAAKEQKKDAKAAKPKKGKGSKESKIKHQKSKIKEEFEE